MKKKKVRKSKKPISRHDLSQIAGGSPPLEAARHEVAVLPRRSFTREVSHSQATAGPPKAEAPREGPHLSNASINRDRFEEAHTPEDTGYLTLAPPNPLDAMSHLEHSLPKTPGDALAEWSRKSSGELKSSHISQGEAELGKTSSKMDSSVKNLAQALIAKDPKAVAEAVKTRANKLEQDVKTWSDWEYTTGNKKSAKLEMLADIQDKLKSGDVDGKTVWEQLGRLDLIERHSEKVPLSDALAFHYAEKQSHLLGLEVPEMGDNSHFDFDHVSKLFKEDPKSLAAFEGFLTKTKERLAETALKGTKQAANPLSELMENEPETAWNVLQSRGQALKAKLLADGVTPEDERINNPVGGDPGIDQILAKTLPGKPAEAKTALKERLKALETLEQRQGYATTSDVATGISKGDLTLNEFGKPADKETWGAFFSRVAPEVAGDVARGAFDAAVVTGANVPNIAVGLAADVLRAPGAAVDMGIRSKGLSKAKEALASAESSIRDSTNTSLSDRLKSLEKGSTQVRKENDLWSLGNLKEALKSESPNLVATIEDELNTNKSIRPDRHKVKAAIEKFRQHGESLSPQAELAIKKYEDEVFGFVSGPATEYATPELTRSVNKGFVQAAQDGKFDHLLSLDGLTAATQALDHFATTTKTGPDKNASKAELDRSYETNMNEVAKQLTDTLLPEQKRSIFNWGIMNSIKRYLLKSTIKKYYLNGLSDQLVGEGFKDLSLSPVTDRLRSTLKNVDFTGGSEVDRAHKKLELSKLLLSVTGQIGKEQKKSDPSIRSALRRASSDKLTKSLQQFVSQDHVDLAELTGNAPDTWAAWGVGRAKTALFQGDGLREMVDEYQDKIAEKTVLPWLHAKN